MASYSLEDLAKFLSIANNKLKKLKKSVKKIRIERNLCKEKLEEIEKYLANDIVQFQDGDDDNGYIKHRGKLELKRDILEILNK